MKPPKVTIPATDRQLEVLEFIRAYVAAHGWPPTVREIGKGLGLKGTRAVSDHLEALRKRGLVQWKPGARRTLTVVK